MITLSLNKNELKETKHSELSRNYGIDLLKILSMINIINLHINLYSPFLNLKPDHPKYKQIYRLEAFSFWAVDAFGIISGIITYKRYKFSNMIYLWFEYFFYSVIMSIYFYFKSIISKRTFIYHFFPLAIRRNWYPNAYILMYFFLPFIINSIKSMNKCLYGKIISCLLFIHSIYHTIINFNIGYTNFDFIDNGYSSLWLLILYIFGAYLGKYLLNKTQFFSKIFLFSIYLFSSFITSEYIFYSLEKYKFPNKLFLQYFSPTIIIQALSLIYFFFNLNITNKYLIKIILFFNPLNFNVTLIHSKIFQFKTQLIKKFFLYIKSLAPKYLFFKIYSISILIYLICAIIDYFRFLLFKIIRIRIICNYIEKKIFT